MGADGKAEFTWKNIDVGVTQSYSILGRSCVLELISENPADKGKPREKVACGIIGLEK